MKGLFDTGNPIDTVTVSELIFKDTKNSSVSAGAAPKAVCPDIILLLRCKLFYYVYLL